MQSIGHISDYNVAYYSAISAVERGMLITKYRSPGFVWSGWVLSGAGRWPIADQTVFFVTGSQGNRWTVNSRTTTIPGSGEGNVDPFLSTGDSTNYNALRYGVSERFLLSRDNTTDANTYYSGNVHNPVFFNAGNFSGTLRLPPFVVSNFGANAALCDDNTSPLCDSDGDGVYDEVKLVRWMQWNYMNVSMFSIIPTLNIFYYSGMWINYDYDNTLRASLLHPSVHLEPTGNGFTFVPVYGESLTGHTVIWPAAATIRDQSFQTILSNNGIYTNIELSLWLVSLLRSFQGSVYPYLEYRMDFGEPIADRFYTIDGHGRNREYDIQIQIKKPTVRGTVGGDFTVIF